MAAGRMIPRIIHQTCPNPAKLDSKTLENIAFLKANNPGWEHRLYSDEDMRDYLRVHLSSDDYRIIQKLNPGYNVVLADLLRYLLVFNEGGVYLDIKSTARKPLASVLKEQDTFILSQWANKMGQQFQGAGIYPELVRVPGGEFQQWHIVASARHPYLKTVIQSVLFNCANYHPAWFGVGKIGVLRLSGPICYTLAIAPIRLRHQHRIEDAAALGFQYTIYPKVGGAEHHTLGPDHYSRQREPIFPFQ